MRCFECEGVEEGDYSRKVRRKEGDVGGVKRVDSEEDAGYSPGDREDDLKYFCILFLIENK